MPNSRAWLLRSVADPCFGINAGRVQNRAALIAILSAKIRSPQKFNLLRALENARVCRRLVSPELSPRAAIDRYCPKQV
jgi:crotonobetainyl-CoA:carnitine CoA-transferase CaiB-like acyl-CoA transferase